MRHQTHHNDRTTHTEFGSVSTVNWLDKGNDDDNFPPTTRGWDATSHLMRGHWRAIAHNDLWDFMPTMHLMQIRRSDGHDSLAAWLSYGHDPSARRQTPCALQHKSYKYPTLHPPPTPKKNFKRIFKPFIVPLLSSTCSSTTRGSNRAGKKLACKPCSSLALNT